MKDLYRAMENLKKMARFTSYEKDYAIIDDYIKHAIPMDYIEEYLPEYCELIGAVAGKVLEEVMDNYKEEFWDKTDCFNCAHCILKKGEFWGCACQEDDSEEYCPHFCMREDDE